jgi:hypothetical protein
MVRYARPEKLGLDQERVAKHNRIGRPHDPNRRAVTQFGEALSKLLLAFVNKG